MNIVQLNYSVQMIYLLPCLSSSLKLNNGRRRRSFTPYHTPLPLRELLHFQPLTSSYPSMERKFSSCSVAAHSQQQQEEEEEEEAGSWIGKDRLSIPEVRTLKDFPREELHGKNVMVRFDSSFIFGDCSTMDFMSDGTCMSIKYLHDSCAKVVLASSWDDCCSVDSAAGFLSEVLQLNVKVVNTVSGEMKFEMDELTDGDLFLLENLGNHKGEFANCSRLAKQLSSIIDIFVNEAFPQSHRMLASTVGITRFCYASLAGFGFEEKLSVSMGILFPKEKSIAIIGGGNLLQKSNALCKLALVYNSIAFVGVMAFPIMAALGVHVHSECIELAAVEEAMKFIHIARKRKVNILVPKDFWCKNESNPTLLEVFPSQSIENGWLPIGIGLESLQELASVVSRSKTVFWIGPSGTEKIDGDYNLALLLNGMLQRGTNMIVVGNMACKRVSDNLNSFTVKHISSGASVVWELIKGRNLPGVSALDRAQSVVGDWRAIYSDPSLPLVVDIGSGNGLFLFKMSRMWSNKNFLGLEINKKLVKQCLGSFQQTGVENLYFINVIAVTAFRSIVGSYKGRLTCVSIQCPNPDFNKSHHRSRILQRALVEAVVDLLHLNGKIFLQSDIEQVALRMKEEFLAYGKNNLVICDEVANCSNPSGWLEENPFGARSDWEQHVVDRGDRMYRTMLVKISA